MQLYSLTPQPESAPVAGTAPTATPAAEEVVESKEVVVTDVVEEPEEEQPREAEPPETADQPSGGGCSAPRSGGTVAMDLSAVFLAVGLAGLGVRRRLRTPLTPPQVALDRGAARP